jgi:ferredoxin-NADP reductase
VTIAAMLHCIRWEAPDVVSIELQPAPGAVFPDFEPGAHIDLALGVGINRSYSLINRPSERGRYIVAVLREAKSRGGSRFVHENLRVGDIIQVSAPRNNFPLVQSDGKTVLVAGGIGITPILCMFAFLGELGRSAVLIYCAKSLKQAAFLTQIDSLTQRYPKLKAKFHFDAQTGGPPDLKSLLQDFGHQAHYYCCGPAPMIDAFLDVTGSLGFANRHVERFSAPAPEPGAEPGGTFTVRLQKSGRSVEVGPGESILDAVERSGLEPSFSCREGVCGSCETTVLSGEPDHRDLILSDAERRAGHSMMICVSRCKGDELVLDL